MASNRGRRRGPALAGALAGVVAAAVFVTAQTQTPTPSKIERFSAKAVNVGPGTGSNIKVDLFGWTTDTVRAQLVDALGKGDKEFFDALKAAPTVGYLWTDASVGYQIRYAYRLPLAGGAERIVLAVDHTLGWTDIKPWESKGGKPTGYPFAVLELQPRSGAGGSGRTSLATKVVVDADKKTIALEKGSTPLVELSGVKKSS